MIDIIKDETTVGISFTQPQERRASTTLASQEVTTEGGTQAETVSVEKVCCGGGCCSLETLDTDSAIGGARPLSPPDNDAFRSLKLKLGRLRLGSRLSKTVALPTQTVSFTPLGRNQPKPKSTVDIHPPKFVTPHPPYDVYSARVHNARELTQPGAEKRTYHFDLDVTDYPAEGGDVDFVVGGAVGVCAPNDTATVDELFQLLGIPRHVRDAPLVLNTTGGRWPTIWGDEKPRELITTRRELVTWCSDLQSFAPTKPLLRLLAEYATEESEKTILTYLTSAQGQAAFCE